MKKIVGEEMGSQEERKRARTIVTDNDAVGEDSDASSDYSTVYTSEAMKSTKEDAIGTYQADVRAEHCSVNRCYRI